MDNIVFHGGCVGCNEQQEKGIDYCMNCRYFDAKWDKPDLSTYKLSSHIDPSPSSIEDLRNNIKERAIILNNMEDI